MASSRPSKPPKARKTDPKGREDWQSSVYDPAKARFSERKPCFETSSGIPIQPLYTPEDTAHLDYDQVLGYPGEYPFTRGVQPTMYRGRFWTMRQYAGFATAAESNRRYKMLLERGQMGLSVAFDLPTQMGYDSDHPLAHGEVGKVGVAIDSLEDFETLFNGIPLDKVSTSMTINAPAAILLSMYIAAAEQQGVSPANLSGTVQNDILKEYAARGTYIYPSGPSMRLAVDIIEYCTAHLPRWNPISISGYHMREAGATAAQELAFTMGSGKAYVQAVLDRGLDVDAFASQLSFFFCCHNQMLEEVAKFRAARRMWARIMKDRFGAKDPKSWMLRFHTQTAGCSLTAQQPLNNIARVTIQALAAVLGGTQSLHTNSYDEALCLPTEEAATVALRTQQIIAHESGLADTIDPLAGSYYVESLTDGVEHKALEYLAEVDKRGGMLKAIDQGYIQREIANSAYAYQQAVERHEQAVVGVNEYVDTAPAAYPVTEINLTAEAEQNSRKADLKARRSGPAVQQALAALDRAARGRDNLMPPILAAVKAYATVGEISDTLRAVFGKYHELVSI